MGAVELPGHGFPCKIRDMGAPRDSDPPNLAVHVPQQDTIVSLDGCVPRRISCTPGIETAPIPACVTVPVARYGSGQYVVLLF